MLHLDLPTTELQNDIDSGVINIFRQSLQRLSKWLSNQQLTIFTFASSTLFTCHQTRDHSRITYSRQNGPHKSQTHHPGMLPCSPTLCHPLTPSGPLRQRRSRQIISYNTISLVAHISWSFCWYSRCRFDRSFNSTHALY